VPNHLKLFCGTYAEQTYSHQSPDPSACNHSKISSSSDVCSILPKYIATKLCLFDLYRYLSREFCDILLNNIADYDKKDRSFSLLLGWFVGLQSNFAMALWG
jgi:hypothetical protein